MAINVSPTIRRPTHHIKLSQGVTELGLILCDAKGDANAGAIELMGEDYTGNPTLNPSRETIDNCEFFHDNNDVKVLYDTYWGMVKNAK